MAEQSTRTLLERQANLERVAETLLEDRQLLVELDRRQNGNRELLAQFRREAFQKEHKAYMALPGAHFMLRMPTPKIKSTLLNEQDRLATQIAETRERVRDQTIELHRLEAEAGLPSNPRLPAFARLKGMTADELYGV